MQTLDRIRTAIEGTEFQHRVYLVGGVIRDRLLGRPAEGDFDLVVVGDAVGLANLLHRLGISDHPPVTYPRFGTARVTVGGVGVELTSARAESYSPLSRKPEVKPATLLQDVLRRDFTVNTLMKGLHDGILLDLTGKGLADLKSRIIRTPCDPYRTFCDDPLRMFRAIRFAVTLDFRIEVQTMLAIEAQAHRIDLLTGQPPVVSAERVRDEFIKILAAPNAARGMQLLLESGLLSRVLPELSAMKGVEQNEWHTMDVWDHTLAALRELREDAPLSVRLGVLFHDVGKPITRSEDERGVHFYRHETVGAEMTERALRRLRMPTDVIRQVVRLVGLHMRLGQVAPEWTDGAVRRLIRDVGESLDALFMLAQADLAATRGSGDGPDLAAVRQRLDDVSRQLNACKVRSPLDGQQIMAVLGIGPGPQVGEAKEYLVNRILDGTLPTDDPGSAIAALKEWWAGRDAGG